MDSETRNEASDTLSGETPRQSPAGHQTGITNAVKQDYKGSFARTTGLEVIAMYHFALFMVRLKRRWEVDRVPQPIGRLVFKMKVEMGVIGGVVVGIHPHQYSPITLTLRGGVLVRYISGR
ncbi:MAG: hypothetical protein ISS55_00005 [Dehalococcoidales bacterium]|nr:hypothetical protein [Dehalococcoidales bacterium]